MEETWYRCKECGADETAHDIGQVFRMGSLCRKCSQERPRTEDKPEYAGYIKTLGARLRDRRIASVRGCTQEELQALTSGALVMVVGLDDGTEMMTMVSRESRGKNHV